MKKTFELTITIEVNTSDEKQMENIDHLNKMVLNGNIQREWVKDGGFKKVKATLKEKE